LALSSGVIRGSPDGGLPDGVAPRGSPVIIIELKMKNTITVRINFAILPPSSGYYFAACLNTILFACAMGMTGHLNEPLSIEFASIWQSAMRRTVRLRSVFSLSIHAILLNTTRVFAT
jgi:hypothetical protein